jgi:hypothetical protein
MVGRMAFLEDLEVAGDCPTLLSAWVSTHVQREKLTKLKLKKVTTKTLDNVRR